MDVTHNGNDELLAFSEYDPQNTVWKLNKFLAFCFVDSKTLKEEKREELFENLKVDESIGWAVDVIDPRELSAKMLKK